ncbi:AAA-ATPase At2g18193-like [Salvia miltiorrhiza]|uniref:AAA-ATPase At2g18193-like n=1 Tax=Salvia miltiorrhiza TaxID=226208 RepID=UPI0025ABF89B|nr:AAA-ATPase At2g18193-like [Salvia miltiorrhiza]
MYPLWEMRSVAGNVFSAYASVATSVMLLRSLANDIVPEPVKSFFHAAFSRFFKHLVDRFFARQPTQMTMVVDEQTGITRNQIYDAAEVYLRTRINPDAERLKVNKSPKQKSITLSMVKDQAVDDCFKGIDLRWQFVLVEADGQHGGFRPERRWFELTFEKSKKQIVVDEYLPFLLSKAQEIRDDDRAVKLFTRDCPFDCDDDDGGNGGGGYWGCVNLDHPATFEKLAMDPNLKRAVIEDLDRFVRRKDYYKKVGKAWKRGYLLYGPPGTGKSSLVAAMANYLKFNVYDLELSNLYSNSELRRMLLCTNNKSIIVIEDIDCSVQLHDRDREMESDAADEQSNTKLTLSGLLNFIDGLWSTCGDERIVIFTTNHKEKLDPALLRPGRMDMHIHMGYCTPEGFEVLALNYLGIHHHPTMFPLIKDMIRQFEVTPAEIAEHLMRHEDVDLALQGVLDLLHQKKPPKNDELFLHTDAIARDNKIGGDAVKDKGKKGNFWKSVIKFPRQLGN